jgi:hypothetical protein
MFNAKTFTLAALLASLTGCGQATLPTTGSMPSASANTGKTYSVQRISHAAPKAPASYQAQREGMAYLLETQNKMTMGEVSNGDVEMLAIWLDAAKSKGLYDADVTNIKRTAARYGVASGSGWYTGSNDVLNLYPYDLDSLKRLADYRQIRPGDHLSIRRAVPHTAIPIWHHAIYVGNGKVVEWAQPGQPVTYGTLANMVAETRKNGFYSEFINKVNSATNGRQPSEMVRAAESLVGKNGPFNRPYFVATDNCEHVVNWCRRGDYFSPEVLNVWGNTMYNYPAFPAPQLNREPSLSQRYGRFGR